VGFHDASCSQGGFLIGSGVFFGNASGPGPCLSIATAPMRWHFGSGDEGGGGDGQR